jgi:molybdate transport system permease protein
MIASALMISLKVTLVSVLFNLFIGTALARLFVRHKFKGRGLIETIIILPMFLPPSVIGYILLLIIGRQGVIGKMLYGIIGRSITFTWQAAVLAAFVVSLPMMYQSAKAAFLSVDPIYEEVAKVMGASDWVILLRITLPLTIKGIVSGAVLAFGRAFGEFGATLMVAGNIPGKTQTIPMAIYYAVEGGDSSSANMMVALVLIISFSIIFITNKLYKTIAV